MKSKYGKIGMVNQYLKDMYKEKLEEKAKEINERGDNFEGFE